MQNVCDLEAWGGTASDSSVSSEPSAEWRCLDDCNHRNPEAKTVRRWLQIWNLQVLQFNHLPLVPVLFLNELMSGSTCGWTTSDHHHATGFQWLQNHSASRRNKKKKNNKQKRNYRNRNRLTFLYLFVPEPFFFKCCLAEPPPPQPTCLPTPTTNRRLRCYIPWPRCRSPRLRSTVCVGGHVTPSI